ncbi:MAG: DUF177 domain-containing protein [Pyrinomonadaceae bacterium]
MRIELADLKDGVGSVTHVYHSGELDLNDDHAELSAPAEVTVNIENSGAKVVVSGKVEISVGVECDRCLQRITVPVKAEFDVEYISRPAYESSYHAELMEEELSVSVFDGAGIDLDEIVREQVLLNVPSRALCAETCKGICSQCGANLNVITCDCGKTETDPRWDALKQLKRR